MSNQVAKNDIVSFIFPYQQQEFDSLQTQIDALDTDYDSLTLNGQFKRGDAGLESGPATVILKRIGREITLKIPPFNLTIATPIDFFVFTLTIPPEWRPPNGVNLPCRTVGAGTQVGFVQYDLLGGLAVFAYLDGATQWTAGNDRGWDQTITVKYYV